MESSCGEHLWEFDGQDDGFLERFFCGMQTATSSHRTLGVSESTALERPARSFLVSGSTSSSSPSFLPPVLPPTPFSAPLAPTAALPRSSELFARCSLSFSARSRYSVNFFGSDL